MHGTNMNVVFHGILNLIPRYLLLTYGHATIQACIVHDKTRF
jgi:hypothetical protein